MSRITELFSRKKERIVSIYYTAGFPTLESTLPVMKALERHGADLVELGMPYSDPLADGPVIQHSSSVAIANGMTIGRLFEQLADLRQQVQLPVVLMGYMNPVLQYGFERFCADAASAGVDGLILPDLPAYEFEHEYGAIIKQYGLDFIFLVTPETDTGRIKMLDGLSSGFLYAVSSSSTTGSDKSMLDTDGYLQKLSGLKLKNPVLVGFGIRDKAGFDAACRHASGGIVGSAFVKALGQQRETEDSVKEFLSGLLG